jgi:hypothetical protein
VNLSAVEEIDVSLGGIDRVLIRWRQGGEWSEFAYVDQDAGYVDTEEVLWWLLRHDAPLECIRRALVAVYRTSMLTARSTEPRCPTATSGGPGIGSDGRMPGRHSGAVDMRPNHHPQMPLVARWWR